MVTTVGAGEQRASNELWYYVGAGNTEITGPSDISADAAGLRIGGSSEPKAEDVPRAGEAWAYGNDWVKNHSLH